MLLLPAGRATVVELILKLIGLNLSAKLLEHQYLTWSHNLIEYFKLSSLKLMSQLVSQIMTQFLGMYNLYCPNSLIQPDLTSKFAVYSIIKGVSSRYQWWLQYYPWWSQWQVLAWSSSRWVLQGVLCLRGFLRLWKNNHVSRKPWSGGVI